MFSKIINKEDAKALYRRLAFHLHPDRGGDHELMVMLTNAYEECIEIIDIYNSREEPLQSSAREQQPKKPKRPEGKYSEVYEDVLSGNEVLSIFGDIEKYANTHKTFKTTFIESVKEFLEENGYITASQYNAMVNVYYQFHMHKKL